MSGSRGGGHLSKAPAAKASGGEKKRHGVKKGSVCFCYLEPDSMAKVPLVTKH